MKIEKEHINHIKTQFAAMQTKEDLVKLLSDAKNFLYGEKCKPIKLKALTYYANSKICKKRYKTFTIKKKSGTNRTINAPVKGLKSILRSLNFVLQCIYEPHESATGFVLNKSIVDNAKKHVGANYVYNLDLKDFFHSFDIYRVKFGILKEVFGIVKLSHYRESNPQAFKTKEELAFLIASLTTHPFEIDCTTRTVLPQGSPTSPTLTNILCKTLDRRLNGLAKRFNVTYTRYADDITFSSSHNIYNKQDFQDELKRIIQEDQKLEINPRKTRLQNECHRQEVTGLVVNDKVNVKRRYVKQIRSYIYYWERYGHKKAAEIFKKDYNADKSHVKNMNAKFINVLEGKLLYLKMVKGEQDGTYIKLKNRFDKLVSFESPINDVLDVWENEGVEAAMAVYYNKTKIMNNYDSEAKLQQYIKDVKSKLSVLPSVNAQYQDIVLAEFKTHYKNGKAFTHSNGEHYGIAVFNCIAEPSTNKIVEFIKNNRNNLPAIKRFVETQKLTDYVHSNTTAYKEWRKGDIGNGYLEYNKEKNKYSLVFANKSAERRSNENLRELPVE